MPNNPLFYSATEPSQVPNLIDQIQIALAIADATLLKSLLVNCIPAILQPRHIGAIAVELGVPTRERQSADGVLQVEAVKCVVAESPQPLDLQPGTDWNRESRELAKMTQHTSDMQTLGQNLTLAATVSLLAQSGFTPEQTNSILRLPQDGWHKSWWYAIDACGNYTIPFLRHIRTLHYPDGTFTIQYKDFFEQDKPCCFASLPQKVLLAIRPDGQGFGETLTRINHQRQALNIRHTVLICNTLSELEAQGFINQGISVYPAVEVILPSQANCAHCGRRECAMNGLVESPIVLCYGFLPESEFV